MGKGGQGLYPPGTVTLDGGPFAGPRGQDLILAGDILLIEHLAMDMDMITFEGSCPMLSAGDQDRS